MKKYFNIMIVVIVFPILLSSCWWKKDIDRSMPSTESHETSEESPYTLEELDAMFGGVAEQTIDANDTEIQVSDIHGYISGHNRNIKELLLLLTGSESDTIKKRSYLLSYLGNYEQALMERDALCNTGNDKCDKTVLTLDIGSASDEDGNTIGAPRIFINTREISSISSIVQEPVYDDMIHRIRIEKEGYLDSFVKVTSIGSDPINIEVAPVLSEASVSIVMDNQIGGTYTAGTGENTITYTILPNSFSDKNGKVVLGNINLYLFALGAENQNLSVFGLDTFSPNGQTLGSNMITDGMPFVTAYQNGAELRISKPILGTGQMQLNQTFSMDMEGVPKNTWLSNDELTKYGLPGYWKLDRDNGVWIESRMQILDNNGAYRFEFE